MAEAAVCPAYRANILIAETGEKAQQALAQIGCGVVDLSFQTPGSEHPDQLMEALELFGKKVLPHIHDV
jgi:hypothetical protein